MTTDQNTPTSGPERADQSRPPEDLKRWTAQGAEFSLSQYLLAPLDAIFKAQIHAARSFLNMLFQIGYRHQPVDSSGNPSLRVSGSESGPTPVAGAPDRGAAAAKGQEEEYLPYFMQFHRKVKVMKEDGKEEERLEEITIPALALVPVAPLGVESAEFQFAMEVRRYSRHTQTQESESDQTQAEAETSGFSEHKRPWYLVREPISIRGTIASKESEQTTGQTIQVHVKVARLPIPAGLERTLSVLTNAIVREDDHTTIPPGDPSVE